MLWGIFSFQSPHFPFSLESGVFVVFSKGGIYLLKLRMVFVETVRTGDGGQIQEPVAGPHVLVIQWDELTSEGWTSFTLGDLGT